MTPAERNVAVKATTQAVLGNGMFMNEREFKAEFCKEHNVTESQLTKLVKEFLAGG